MPLILTITPARGEGDRQIRTLANGTVTIGRAAGNDWVLADPDQHLSRTHCMIASEGGRYVLTDLSTNGLLINGAREPTTRNSRIVLTDGDTVRLGKYELSVAEADGAAGGASANPFGASSFLGGHADPFAGGGDRAGDNPLDVDPLDDPLGRPTPSGFPQPAAPPPSLRTEDPFDRAEGARRRPATLDEDLFRGDDAGDAWKGPAQREAGAVGSQAFSPPRTEAPAKFEEIDFDALLGDLMPAPAAPPAAPPKPGRTPPTDTLDDLLGDGPVSAPTPPRKQAGARAAAASPVPAAEASPAPPTGASASDAALLAAFLDGAGLSRLNLSGQSPEATMRAVGALLRAFATGTREVLISRAEVKHEMRVERTMIRSRDNNALKFSISPDEALAALLQPDRPGYKPPLDAVDEAFGDIRSHEMAVMAGMQTALIALLKRFDPAGLESRLQRGMLDAVLPGARKARFWELFCATYKDIAREAEDDFHSIFGREFARAYDAQIRKL